MQESYLKSAKCRSRIRFARSANSAVLKIVPRPRDTGWRKEISIDVLPDGYFELDSEGRFSLVNTAFFRLMGRRSEELSGMHWRQVVSFIDRSVVEEALNRVPDAALQENENIWAGWLLPDGSERRGIWGFGRIPAQGRMEERICGTLRDVTEKEAQESEVRQYSQQLEMILSQQNEQLEKLGHQYLAAQKMEAVGTLTGSVAHNFNNVLMGVQGTAELIQYHLGLEPRFRKHLDRIQRLIDNGSRLTQQLLDYMAVNKPKLQQVSITHLIKESAGLILSTRSNIALEFDLPTDPLWCTMDQGLLEQVFMNLYVNAVDAMANGGKLSVAAMKKSRESLHEPGFTPVEPHYAVVQVRDSGEGMPPEIQARIFEPLFTTKSYGKGTGLGLSTVQMTLKKYGGHISVCSTQGKGSVFTLWVPIVEGKPQYCGIVPVEPVCGNETILLFDADKEILETFTAMLETLGYRVIIANSWQVAAEKLTSPLEKVDLAILDVSLFRKTAWEEIEAMVQLREGIKLLLTSGRSNNLRLEKHVGEHHRFLQKPFSLVTFSASIRELLNSAHGSGHPWARGDRFES